MTTTLASDAEAITDESGQSRAGLTDEELEERKGRIGASDVAAIMGLDPYRTRYQVFHEKAGTLKTRYTSTEATERGHRLEVPVAQWAAWKYGWTIKRAEDLGLDKVLYHREIPRLGATPDFFITHTAESGELSKPILLQIKTGNARMERDHWHGGPPLHYLVQVQAEIMCAQPFCAPESYIVALLGESMTLKKWKSELHEATAARIEKAVRDFWREVDEFDPPPVDYNADAKTISRLMVDLGVDKSAPPVVLADEDAEAFDAACARYKEAAAKSQEWDGKKKAAQAEIADLLGQVHKVTSSKFRVTSTVVEGTEVSYYREPYHRLYISQLQKEGEQE